MQLDPIEIADFALGVAQMTGIPVYLEPHDDLYALRVEGSHRLVDVPMTAALGRAAIARLAFIGELDVAGTHSGTARTRVRCDDAVSEVVITIRSGTELRADLTTLPRVVARRPGPDLQIGAVIGNYRVTRLIGEGGMGTVVEVVHTDLDRRFALKVLRSSVIERDRDAGAQFLREARLAARIRHPGIVDVVDFGYLDDARPYLVMEHLEGESLASVVDRGPLAIEDVIRIARQLSSALAAAHDVGVIHADVTPANALLANEVVKLVDFGLARTRSEGGAQTDMVVGTPAYISPEQLRGLPATELSDQYGLGALLFHLIVGRPPFEDPDLREMCRMHLESPVPAVKSPIDAMPSRLADVVTRCLQKSPANRFPDMHGVVSAIDEIGRIAKRRDWTRWLAR